MSRTSSTAMTTTAAQSSLAPIDESRQASLVSTIEQLAANPNVDVTKLEKIIELQRGMLADQAREQFTIAFSRAQQAMRSVAANATNPQTRSKYATYEALDRALRPIYTENGFALSFNTAESPLPEHMRIVCDVMHIGGHSKPYHVDMPADGKGAKGGDVMTKTHAAGAAMSYGMRYLLRMIWNVAVGEGDTDGNAPREREAKAAPKGYDEWLSDLQAVAANGTEALKAAWSASKPQYRRHLMDDAPETWDGLKAKAAEVQA